MKLRNKRTGEIHEITQAVFLSDDMNKKFAIYSQSEGHNYAYRTIAELNEEWEDYEEPKSREYWYIEDIDGVAFMDADLGERYNKFRKSIGNYFETKEEAEKAVEKLKAWKRLKDKGFRFTEISRDWDTIYFDVDIENLADPVIKDLDICFGGEE